MMYNTMQGMGWSGGSVGLVFWVTTLLVWTLLIVAIFAIIKWINKK